MTGTVLILGANGRFGRHATDAFWNAGWTVRRFDRQTDDLITQAEGVDIIVNGWNPKYTDWARDLPDLTDQVIAAATHSKATVIQASNVYVYGKDAPERFGADSAHQAKNPMGQLRRDMEETLRQSGVKVVFLRAGDFLDTEASGNWFDMIMAPSLKKGALTYPGNAEAPHAWAWLPDVARACVGLADQHEALPQVTEVPFPGYTMSGTELAALCAEALGRPVRVKPMNWLPIQMARPFWRMAAPLLEMRYLWSKPHYLAGDTLTRLLPDFLPTPASEAVARAVTAALAKKDQPTPKSADQTPAQAA